MKTFIVIAIALIAWMSWSSGSVFAAGGDVSAVNKSVSASAGQSYGSLSTVNGDVRVGRGATASEAKTVNGSIHVDADARVGTVSTVNGSVDISEGVAIDGDASTVNGDIDMERRSRAGAVTTVNGDIELEGAEVRGQVTTSNGDIELSDGARVLGGILVKKSRNWGVGKASKPLEVSICSTCVVEGELRFERPVRLRVEQGARIGAVIGAEVTRP